MIKSWLISLVVFLLIGLAIYLNIFEWLASSSASIIGGTFLIVILIIARIVLGSPFKKN
ncbi:MAG: hypothetical protein IKA03_00300 [Alphaproteobacteria bacterium]|nr:hypothetical protein [Alphaproteobacteria bacterium]